MGTEPVRVWVGRGACGALWWSRERRGPFDQIPASIGLVADVPTGEYREFVMVPASEYQTTADLSHADIVRTIAEIAHQDWLVALKEDSLAPKDASVRVAAKFVELAMEATRKIEGAK